MSREHLVVGPPGCGKTSYLSRQAGLAMKRYSADGVLISSLTRSAAEEVASRNPGLHPERIGTLHSHAFRSLDRPKVAESTDGFKSWNQYVENEGLPGALRIDPKDGVDDVEWKPSEARMRGIGVASGEAMLQQLAIYRARMAPTELWNPMVRDFSRRWEDFKTQANMLDFTDLIETAMHTTQWAPGRPSVMMIDEAQDMSKLEFALARKWAGHCEQTVTVGDPDQCLYDWRGTDPAAMTDHDFASESTLSRSYRVPSAVHAYAVSWINRIEGRRPVEYRPRLEDPEDPDGPEAPGELRFCGHTWRRPEGLINRMEQDIEDGFSVMALASCSYMIEPLIAQLKNLGLPFHNPYRPQHGGWNPMRGARRLLSFLRPSEETWGEDAAEWTWQDVQVWLAPMKQQGNLKRGSKSRVENWSTERADEQPSLTDLEELFVSPADLFKALELDVPWWIGTLLEKDAKVQRYPSKIYEQRGGVALRERPQITIGTIHSVKGGEADSVYVFPDLSRAGWEDTWENPSRRSPTYRLFYVAFTRARERLTLCSASSDYAVNFPREA